MAYDHQENRIKVAFPGSKASIQNWMTNFDYDKVKVYYCYDCEVHEGFYKAY